MVAFFWLFFLFFPLPLDVLVLFLRAVLFSTGFLLPPTQIPSRGKMGENKSRKEDEERGRSWSFFFWCS